MSGDNQKQPGMDRRRFLAASCGAALGFLLGRGMAGASGGREELGFAPPARPQERGGSKAVLIAYASRCGSTGGVAQAMGEALGGLGASVDLRLVENVKELGSYQAVIVGSAIRAGRWLPEATAFVKSNQEALGSLPLAFFVVCMTMREDTHENRAKVLAYLDPLRKGAPGLTPAAVGLFPGAVDYGKLSFMHRSILEAKGVPEGDYRDLPAVRAWASQVGPALLA